MAHLIEITIRLSIDADKTPETVEAVSSLANIMLVQAEDGLYTGGYPEAELWDVETNERVENKFLGDIPFAEVVRIVEAR